MKHGAGLPELPLRAVAALFLERQHLARPRGQRLGAKSLSRFAEDTGGIQLDSINVVERAHHLTLWNRFGPYDRKRLDELLYSRRVLFEYWAHAACLVPTTHLAPWRRAMADYSLRSRAWGSWLRKNRTVLAAVEETIRSEGPLGNLDFTRREAAAKGRRRSPREGWWDWKPATHALDYLWMSGRTMVHSRRHFQKIFDLAERVLAEAAAVMLPEREEFVRWHVRRSLHAMGAATWTDLRLYLTFPRLAPAERRRALATLLESGEVVEVAIEGESAPWFALAADLPALARASRGKAPSRGSALLAPFDSLLWHRERAKRLFGFDYKIEVYTPGHSRVHGYYTLPILHEGQLIGRMDPKTHREERRLEVRSLHLERWFAKGEAPPAASWGAVDRDAALAGIAVALRSLAAFVGADEITLGRVVPARFAPALRRALKGV